MATKKIAIVLGLCISTICHADSLQCMQKLSGIAQKISSASLMETALSMDDKCDKKLKDIRNIQAYKANELEKLLGNCWGRYKVIFDANQARTDWEKSCNDEFNSVVKARNACYEAHPESRQSPGKKTTGL